jgi:hypothetical protein
MNMELYAGPGTWVNLVDRDGFRFFKRWGSKEPAFMVGKNSVVYMDPYVEEGVLKTKDGTVLISGLPYVSL